ncbi:hypothetical protein [Acidovorax sp.]|uniref:hypothetical protein n=1 Tax=Acidovorax sp. TaxID=1872122 RepID=UPI002607D636|nr:hypothetical protein [Acidovorax sp.]
MSTSAARSPELLQARLQEFNLLPSRSLHVDRAHLMAPAEAHTALFSHPGVQRALHRRWSEQLLAGLGEDAQPVLDLSHVALPYALAAPSLLRQLVRNAGVALLGQHLRRTIARDAVLHARETLGDADLDWARSGAAAVHPGLENSGDWVKAGLDKAADLLGAGVLAQSWQDAPAPIRLRADWKLPPAATDASAVRTASALDPQGARQFCRQLLARLDPAWLSSFPATR